MLYYLLVLSTITRYFESYFLQLRFDNSKKSKLLSLPCTYVAKHNGLQPHAAIEQPQSNCPLGKR
jgi:hypothetical protein